MSYPEFYVLLNGTQSTDDMKCEQMFVSIRSCPSAHGLLRREREALQHYKCLGGDPVDFYTWYSGMALRAVC